MIRRSLTILLGALLLAAPAPDLYAHENYRIIGTVEKVTATDLSVKQTKDGKVVDLISVFEAVAEKSTVTRDKKKVAASELKPGLHVVVDARGDSLLELDIVEVRIVPPPAKK